MLYVMALAAADQCIICTVKLLFHINSYCDSYIHLELDMSSRAEIP